MNNKYCLPLFCTANPNELSFETTMKRIPISAPFKALCDRCGAKLVDLTSFLAYSTRRVATATTTLTYSLLLGSTRR